MLLVIGCVFSLYSGVSNKRERCDRVLGRGERECVPLHAKKCLTEQYCIRPIAICCDRHHAVLHWVRKRSVTAGCII